MPKINASLKSLTFLTSLETDHITTTLTCPDTKPVFFLKNTDF